MAQNRDNNINGNRDNSNRSRDLNNYRANNTNGNINNINGNLNNKNGKNFQQKNKRNNKNNENLEKRYNEKDATKEFLSSEKGFKLLYKIGKPISKEDNTISKIDQLIDNFCTWAGSFPVRKNLKITKYDFLKHVENFCMEKDNEIESLIKTIQESSRN